MADGQDHGGFLPPQPRGPEPAAGAAPPSPPAPYGQPPWIQPQRDPSDPGNSPAVVALVLGLVSGGFLVTTIGLSTIVSLGLGITGIVFGVQARGRIREGVTAQNREMSTAGFVISIVATVVSAIACVVWGALFVLAASDDSSGGYDDGVDTILPPTALLRGVTTAGHTLATLLG